MIISISLDRAVSCLPVVEGQIQSLPRAYFMEVLILVVGINGKILSFSIAVLESRISNVNLGGTLFWKWALCSYDELIAAALH